MTPFACAIESLIGVLKTLKRHSDHRGVSNSQLAIEAPEIAQMYSNKSIAEQNSLDLAWDILMQDRFANLRWCLFTTQEELIRFRQLIVNIVCTFQNSVTRDVCVSGLDLTSRLLLLLLYCSGDGHFRCLTWELEKESLETSFRRRSKPEWYSEPWSKSNHCHRAHHSSFWCISHNAALACLQEVESMSLQGNVRCVQTGPIVQRSQHILVSRGIRILWQLCHSSCKETEAVWCLWCFERWGKALLPKETICSCLVSHIVLLLYWSILPMQKTIEQSGKNAGLKSLQSWWPR